MPKQFVLPYLMKQRRDRDGYMMTGYTMKVHRAVAEAFIPNPNNLPEVCHCNGVRSDNKETNLRWGTRRDNFSDMVAHGTIRKGVNHTQAKLSPAQVRDARTRAATGESHSSIARSMPVERSVLSRAIRGDTWSHV
jgi:hypothetical protein